MKRDHHLRCHHSNNAQKLHKISGEAVGWGREDEEEGEFREVRAVYTQSLYVYVYSLKPSSLCMNVCCSACGNGCVVESTCVTVVN